MRTRTKTKNFFTTLLRPMLVIGLALFLAPLSVSATDAYITQLDLTEQGSTEPGAATTYTLALNVDGEIPAGTTISIYPTSLSDGDPMNSGFTLTADFDSTIDGTGGTSESVIFELFLNSKLSSGKHPIELLGVTNSSTDGTYMWNVTTESLPPTNSTQSPTFIIGTGGDDPVANPFTALSVTPSSTGTGEATSYEVEFTTNADINAGELFSFFLQDANNPAGPSNFDFSAASFDSGTIDATLSAGDTANFVSLTPNSKLAAGNHEFTLDPVSNETIAGDYQAVIVMGAPGEGADITLSDSNFTLEDIVTANPPEAPTGLSVKKLKQRSATLQWEAVDGADSYKMRVDRKVKKNYRKVKVFKNLEVISKKVGKKYLKPGKQYRFRTKACNEIGCSAWSAQKKFRTKPAA